MSEIQKFDPSTLMQGVKDRIKAKYIAEQFDVVNEKGERFTYKLAKDEELKEPQSQPEIKSRQQHEDDRIIVLSEAIAGALKEGKEVDLDWGKELNDLLERKRNYDQPNTTYFVGPNSQTRIVPNHPYHGINGPVH